MNDALIALKELKQQADHLSFDFNCVVVDFVYQGLVRSISLSSFVVCGLVLIFEKLILLSFYEAVHFWMTYNVN